MDCPSAQQLPEWIEYAKVFSTPFVALIAGSIASLIAFHQLRTAREKLRLDLFEKRYVHYKTVKKTIETAKDDKEVDLSPYLLVVGEAGWLFDIELKKYLMGDLLVLIRRRDTLLKQYQGLVQKGFELDPDDEDASSKHHQEVEQVDSDLFNNYTSLDAQLKSLPAKFDRFMKIVA